MSVKEIECKNVDWIYLSYEMGKLQALVKMVMNYRVS